VKHATPPMHSGETRRPLASDASFFSSPAVLNKSSRRVLVGGVLLIGTLVASATALMWQDYRQTVQQNLRHLALLAGVTQAYATQVLDANNRLLDRLANDLTTGAPSQTARLEALMAIRLEEQPYLRGLALLDAQGRVLLSTTASERGGRTDLSRLTALPPPGHSMAVRPWVAGLTLTGSASTPEGVGFVPLARPIPLPGSAAAWLVAQLDPGALLPPFADPPEAQILLTLSDGALLAQAGHLPLRPGESVTPHPAFARSAPSRESHGALLLWGDRHVGAWQASAQYPLVSIVEQPHAVTLQQWLAAQHGPLLLIGLATVLIGLLTRLSWRHARARERAQQELEAAHEETSRRGQQLSLLVKNVQELIFRTNLHGNIRFANARWQAITGESARLARGRYLSDVVLPEYREQVAALFALRGDLGVRAAQVSLQGTDGQVRVLDISVVPLSSRDGEIHGFAGSAVDVTDLLAAQQQLQAQLTFTELVLECNPLPICLTDTEGRFVTVNQAWEKFMSLPRREVLGRRNVDFLPVHEAQAYEAYTAQLLREGGRVSYEERLHRPDGDVRDVQITKVQLRSSRGESLGILTTKLDITEFRAARDLAEEASRTKSEFVANISHELRTPLQSILGFSELGILRGREHPKLAAMFGDIHAAGKNMLGLVNDLLDIAKIESTVGAFHFERTDLRNLIQDVAEEMQSLLQRKRLTLNTQLGPLPLFAKVDPLRFQQVVRNILSNALKFSPEGASIEITAGLEDASALHIQVRDHGLGIPPAELESVFEAFVQSSQTRDGSGGTGLGLAICRKIIAAHGGRIHAGNAHGGGAVFHIHLPTASYSETLPSPLT